jgi:hypothetical protein
MARVSGLLIGMVLFAALLHAIWNAIAKSIPDRLVASALIGVVYLVGGALGALLLPLPAAGAWPFLIGSAVLQVAVGWAGTWASGCSAGCCP